MKRILHTSLGLYVKSPTNVGVCLTKINSQYAGGGVKINGSRELFCWHSASLPKMLEALFCFDVKIIGYREELVLEVSNWLAPKLWLQTRRLQNINSTGSFRGPNIHLTLPVHICIHGAFFLSKTNKWTRSLSVIDEGNNFML